MRKPLTAKEIVELDQALVEAFTAHKALLARVPAARHLKFPQMPPILAESIVIVAAKRLFGDEWQGALNGSASDVRLANGAGTIRKVEVKSTGVNGFQELKPKDLAADCLVWLHFGDRYLEGAGKVRIIILDNPGSHIDSPVRLDIRRLLKRLGECRDLREMEVPDLETLIGR